MTSDLDGEGMGMGASAATPEPPAEAEALPGHRPPLFDGGGLRALATVGLTVVAWAWIAAMPTPRLHPLSPVLLLAHLVLLVLSVRAALALPGLWNRLRLAAEATRCRLVLEPRALRLEGPLGVTVVPRSEIVDIRERGDWRRRRGGKRFAEVFVVRVPEDGRVRWLAIPPLFERTPGVLAERLMRWRGPLEPPAGFAHPEPARIASRVYEEAAAGRPPGGGLAVRHGRGWLRRGPYATLLLGAVLVERAIHVPARAWSAVAPGYLAGIAACLAAVPLVWAFLQRRHVAPRKGLALVLTPAEVLIRIRSGILRVTWPNLARVHVEVTSAWSVLEGQHAARILVLERAGAPPIRYDEAFLGVPAEVAQGLCEAYRRGLLPR